MKLHLSSFTAVAIAAVLSTLPGCSDDEGGPGGTTASSTTSGSTTTSGTGTGTGGAGPGGGGSGGTDSVSASSGGGSTVSGTGGAGGDSSGIPATFDTVRQIVREASCSDATCHNGEAEPRLQDDETLYETLRTFVSVRCGNIPAVTPGDPERSALVKLLKGPCGDLGRMPRGCVSEPIEEYNCLPQEYIDAVEQWVANGAPRE